MPCSEANASLLWEAYRADPLPGGAAESALLAHYAPLVKMVRGRAFAGDRETLAGYSLEPADLEQEGALGLLLAIRRYDPSRGRFESFANQYVWGMLQKGLKTADLTPAAAAAKGERWNVVALAEPEAEALLADLPEMVETVESVQRETALARALRRLTADHRAAFRLACFPGEVPGREGTLTPAQIARRLGLRPREVRHLVTETQAVVRYLLGRQGVLSVRQNEEFHWGEKPVRKPGRPRGRKFPVLFEYVTDAATRDMSRRLAAFEGKSEAAVHRQAIREKFERLAREHPDDPRLSLGP